MHDELAAHVTSAAVIVYVIEWLKGQSWFSWLTPDTKILNAGVSGVLALAAVAGISWTFEPTAGQLIITGLTVNGITHSAWEWLVQYISQQVLYDGVIQRAGTTK